MSNNDNDMVHDKAPRYWLSLEQWSNAPAFAEAAKNEFRSSPWGDGAKLKGQEGFARREFLQIMGASIALTSFGCVRRPAQKIIPYANRPEEVVPGSSNYYTSSYVDGTEGFGLLVTTREGRPIKVDGNPSHPMNKGKMSARGHASILNLYDPERTSGVLKGATKISWEDFDKEMLPQLAGGGVALLTSATSSPSRRRALDAFKKRANAKHFVWDALNDEALIEGQKRSYGDSVRPRNRFDKAKYIVALDSDFLGAEGNATEATIQFASLRNPEKEMTRLVSFESLFSLTGMNADTRYRVRASEQLDVVMGLLNEIIVVNGKSKYASDSRVKTALAPYSVSNLKLPKGALAETASELWSHRGESLVIAGRKATNAVDVQVAVNFLNHVLGNDGKTMDAKNAPAMEFDSSVADLKKLVDSINSGEIKTLIIQGANPVYAAPAELNLAEAIKKVSVSVFVGDRANETGSICTYVASESHPMEAWGDAELQKGVYSIQQPTIRPLNDTRSFDELLVKWSGSEESWYDFVKATWKNLQGKNRKGIALKSFDQFWLAVLEEGVFNTSNRDSNSSARGFKLASFTGIRKPAAQSGVELVLYSKVGIKDGNLANVSWLQELPDPVTKVVWDNYLMVSLKAANTANLKTGSLVELTCNGHTAKVPVLVQPGMHDDVVALAVGYGRTAAGSVANGVGVNAFPFAKLENGIVADSGLSATYKKVSGSYDIVSPQGHNSMEGRQIIIEATQEQFKKNPEANIHRHKMMTMWGGHEYKGNKWGMNIDLTKCTGCSACVVACQSENNIPTVGKEYVKEGRIMQWIRVDCYYAGDPVSPEALFMPVSCQHCDNAPCETVCPVAATVHNDEGLNDMVYNRCVGTRYCANNCPYKVRRFNWFDYTKDIKSPQHLSKNPEVSIRERGVMEKCSFCLHRINQAKHDARVEERELKDGDVVVACQQSCPSDAIVFGNTNDKTSKVSQAMAEKRTYSLLEELNAKPALKYRTKIRNSKTIALGNHDSGKGHH